MKFIILFIISLLTIPFGKGNSYTKNGVDKIFNNFYLLFWIMVGLSEYFLLIDDNVTSVLVEYSLIGGIIILIITLF